LFREIYIFDELIKSRISIKFVIPVNPGIHLFQEVLYSGFRWGDDPKNSLPDIFEKEKRMKIVCLLGSPRNKGNSSTLAKHFCDAADKLA